MRKPAPKSHTTVPRRAASVWTWVILCLAAPTLVGAEQSTVDLRREMVERARHYLFSAPKQGALGDSRQKGVTALFVLACLSSGLTPADLSGTTAITDALDFIARSSSTDFFGGPEEPNKDHAWATLMWIESVGTAAEPDANLELFARARLAMQYALRIQDKGVGAQYYGGWRRNDQTRVNDRLLSTWYLFGCHAAALRGIPVPGSSIARGTEFVSASQKLTRTQDRNEQGGFSVDANGLTVRSATAAGLLTLALFDPDNEEAIGEARDWLARHPPRWHGPSFFETNFFAVRGLYRVRHLDDGKAFALYFGRLVRILHERQEPDGSFPFPPGHGGPIVAMGPAYSTAMAALILNVDRGIVPMDK